MSNPYSKGIILGALKRRAEAIECLILSVTAYPWNWSAWLQLGALIEDPEEVRTSRRWQSWHAFKASSFAVAFDSGRACRSICRATRR